MEYSLDRVNVNKLDAAEIKKSLLSRKIEKKILAAKQLCHCLTNNADENFVLNLLNEDLVEMLCEATCTTNVTLLKNIFKCLFMLMKCSQFFQQNRCSYTLESIIRSLYILVKTGNEDHILLLGLQLVCDIICRIKTLKVLLGTTCNISNLINLLRQLFKSKCKKVCIYAATEVLISLLHSLGILKYKKIMEDSISEALTVLADEARKCKNKDCIVIISEVVNGSIRFLQYPKVEFSTSAIFPLLFSILKEILTPFLIEYQDSFQEKDAGTIQIILSALLSIYYYPEDPATKELSHFLISKGFLKLLPLLEADIKEMELTVVIRSLLLEMLQCMSYSILGKENWKNLLLPGFEVLPPGDSYKTICCFGTNEIIPISSIIFNYFDFLSSQNPTIESDFLYNLSCYVFSISETPSPSITKAVWFIYAVAYLCSSENLHFSYAVLAKLINFIMQYNIVDVYTHHPAILYWAFSDNSVPNELQANIIKLWLGENDKESTDELKTLLTINRESCLVMLDLMACESKLCYIIYRIWEYVLLKSNNVTDYISEHAWAIFPQQLVQFSSFAETNHYECINTLMKFCCKLKPKNVDISLVLRISCLLPGAFCKYINILHPSDRKEKITLDDLCSDKLQSTFNFINNLLQISLEINDKRVSAVFLNHEAFLNAVELVLNSESEATNASLMQLLTSFLHCQNQTSQKSLKTIHIDVLKLIQFLFRKTEICIETLKFLTVYLEIISYNALLPLVNIPLPTATQLRTLYLQIHMLCVKSVGETSIYCWSCLRRLLELSDSIGLKDHLASIPYTTTLLMESSETKGWQEAISFILTWLPNAPRHGPRALDVSIAVETLNKLNEKLKKTIKDPNITTVLSKALQLSFK